MRVRVYSPNSGLPALVGRAKFFQAGRAIPGRAGRADRPRPGR